MAALNAANLSNTIAAVASGAADILGSAKVAAQNFLGVDNNNKGSISPRMTPIKHELYFPQCYPSPFNQPFPGGTPIPEGVNVNNNNSGESSPTALVGESGTVVR